MVEPVRLFEFVGLALPAVAILIQVINSIHANDEEPENGWLAERRLVEMSFVLLVVAGAVFGAAVLIRTRDLLTQIGIVILLFGLILLAPATWIALNRSRFHYPQFGSPEEAAMTVLRVIRRTGIPIVLLVGVAFFIAVVRPWNSSSGINISRQHQISIGILLVLVVGIIASLDLYLRYQISGTQRIEREKRIKTRLKEIKEQLPDKNTKISMERLRSVSRDISVLKGQIKEIQADAKEGDPVHDELKVKKLTRGLEEVAELADQLRSLQTEIEEHKTSISNLERRLKSRQRQLDTSNASSDNEDLKSELRQIIDKKEKMELTLDEARTTYKQTESDFYDQLTAIHNNIDSLQTELTNSDNTED